MKNHPPLTSTVGKFSSDMIAAIDDQRVLQRPFPSRDAMIRTLLTEALEARNRPKPSLPKYNIWDRDRDRELAANGDTEARDRLLANGHELVASPSRF